MLMKTITLTSLAAAMAATLVTVAAPAATKKKAPVKKPAANAAKAVKAGGPVVLGTKQLPGDFGKFGITYTIGKDNPLNFTLLSAEYRSDRFMIGGDMWGNDADEKALVLNYTVQNPMPSDQSLGWSSLKFSAVDSQDTTHEYVQNTIRTGTVKESLNMTLKPAQKVNVSTVIVVPAEGVIPKLIVERGSDAAVIRYDLRGNVKPIPAPFVDPADASGATPLKNAPVEMGTYIPTGVFDVKLDSVAYTREKTGDSAPEEGKRYFVAIFSIRNATPVQRSYGWSTFKPLVKDADGEKVEYNQTMLKASRNESADGNLEPGEEARIRYFFEMPENVDAKTLSIAEGQGRSLVFDVSGAKAG